MNESGKKPGSSYISSFLCVGYFQKVTYSNTFSRRVLVVTVSGTLYRKCSNTVLASRSLLSCKNNKIYLLKLLPSTDCSSNVNKTTESLANPSVTQQPGSTHFGKKSIILQCINTFYQIHLPACLSCKILFQALWTHG